jgi:acyl-CoA dehydrogenase
MGVLGGQLKRRENTSARIGDVLSYLYLGSAVLKRFEDQGRPEQDEVLMHWASQYCLYQLQESLFALYTNYPVPLIGTLLRIGTFPMGRCFSMPSDDLHQLATQLLMSPSEARDRLCSGIFIPEQPDQPIAELQKTLELVAANELIEKKLKQAVKSGKIKAKGEPPLYARALQAGLLTEIEAQQMQAVELARRKIIAVNDFAKEEI